MIRDTTLGVVSIEGNTEGNTGRQHRKATPEGNTGGVTVVVVVVVVGFRSPGGGGDPASVVLWWKVG